MFNEGPIISLTKSNRIFTMYSNCRPTGGCAVFFHGLRHPWWRSVSGLSLSVYRIPWYIFLAEGQCSHDDRSHKSVQGHPKGWLLPNIQTYPKTRKHSSRMRTAAFLVPGGGGGSAPHADSGGNYRLFLCELCYFNSLPDAHCRRMKQVDPLIMGWRFRTWSVQTSLRTCALEEME